ncbi:response regulator transcription factor [Pyxidicoccus sp. 3LFB2]
MAHLLLIDDDVALLDVLSLSFEDAGHQVTCAKDGTEGLERLRQGKPDLIVSDVNMPGVDGFTLCRRLRGAGDSTPLILLTSRDGEIDEALGLELGADDYVSKPFSTRVLLARVASLLRREELRGGGAAQGPRLVRGALELDAERLEARYQGTLVRVTVTEFRLLEALARRPGVLFSREKLLQLTRDDDSIVVDRIIDTYVRRLRRKLETVDASFDCIETVVGAGYRWKDV